MNYCDDCILIDICGKEDYYDDAITFCADKHKFIDKSVIKELRQEIDSYCSDNKDRNDGLYIAIKIIDKYINEKEQND